MLNSMTGYGEADGVLDGVSYAIEIKAVNNRYLKTIIKLPETCAFLEEDSDKELRKALCRGTVNCVLRFKDISADALFEIDEPGLRSVMTKLKTVSSAIGCQGAIDLARPLRLPGVSRPVL